MRTGGNWQAGAAKAVVEGPAGRIELADVDSWSTAIGQPTFATLRNSLAALWSGIAEVFTRLRGPSLIGLAIYFVFEIADAALMAKTESPLLQNIPSLIRNLLLLPFDIAIFRLLISGEVASQYSFAISAPLAAAGLLDHRAVVVDQCRSAAADGAVPAGTRMPVVADACSMIILTVAFMIRMVVLFPPCRRLRSGDGRQRARRYTRPQLVVF